MTAYILIDYTTPLSVDISPIKGRMHVTRFSAYLNFIPSIMQIEFPWFRGNAEGKGVKEIFQL